MGSKCALLFPMLIKQVELDLKTKNACVLLLTPLQLVIVFFFLNQAEISFSGRALITVQCLSK